MTAPAARDETDGAPPFATFVRITVASYPGYGEAESAVNWLSRQGFPLHHVAIVGTGLRSVEQVADRVTPWRAAVIGALGGVALGGLLALMSGAISPELNSAEVTLYSLGICTLFGAVSGALYQLGSSAGRRDFVSVRTTEADRYEVQVDEPQAAEAARLLAAMPAGGSS